jgi:hypothetical protein
VSQWTHPPYSGHYDGNQQPFEVFQCLTPDF